MSIKVYRFFWVLFAFCVAIPGPATAQNIASNPGFETGNTTNWFNFGPCSISAQTAQVHSGAYAGYVQGRTSTWNGIGQSFQGIMIPGQVYDISAWFKLASGTNQTVQITVQQTDGNGTVYTSVASGTVSSNGWTQLTGTFVLNGSGTLTTLNLYFEVPSSATVPFYVDDVMVTADTTATYTCTLVTNLYQRIDGFGASSAWGSSWSSTVADLFFSTNNGISYTDHNGFNATYNGIGLSLLRSRIAPGATTVESSIMQLAQARGARIWSTPWSPAAQFKTTGDVNTGGFIGNPANYQAYASQLAGYVSAMKTNYGINLYALSVQNEPDAMVTNYESCNWTAQQIHDFVPYLASALQAGGVSATKIILPESQNWLDYSNLAVTAMNDPNVASLVGIIADHNYDGDNGPANLSRNSWGKALWETEVSLLSGSDSSITNAVYWAGRIHQFLTVAGVNAWHYWWLISGDNSGNQGLMDNNATPAKRMFALGQFSRFVRPNYYRTGVANTGPALISAFRDTNSSTFVVVAINTLPNAITQTIQAASLRATNSVNPWITSATQSLVPLTSVGVTNGSFTFSLPALSVVTFVGQGVANSPPRLPAISSQLVNAGESLVLTNTATDPDVPLQQLTYTLVAGPANASLNSTNGVFSWRPLVAQANTTNRVTIQVTDDGIPPLGDSNSFTLTVPPLSPALLSPPVFQNGQLLLSAIGPTGPDYSLYASSNLVTWQLLQTSNSPAPPVKFQLPFSPGQAPRFYRLQLGP